MDLPMFPLGSVLFPGQLLPLHIFEERYQQMLTHCLAAEKEFGVVLIERGHEVGGGDVRSNVGTVAKILQAVEVETGHWAVITAGTRRIRIEQWGTDDPWPHATVVEFPDLDGSAEATPDSAADGWATLQAQFRRVSALAAEVGEGPSAVGVAVADDPGLGSFQIAALSPLVAFDRQKVLNSRSVGERIELLGRLLVEVEEMLQLSLTWDDVDGEPD